jgi:hypothetical protein
MIKPKMTMLAIILELIVILYLLLLFFQETSFKRVFIQGAAGDNGAALGAALFVYYYLLRKKRNFVQRHLYFGPEFSNEYTKNLLDHRILALIPRQGVQFDEVELKALLAYLNSSFAQLQAEAMGRVAGGVALLELDIRPLSSFLVLDVRRLPRGDVERLAQLFDKLESEARRLSGADSAENVYGSELARELTGRTDVRPGIQGLFNTVIREIDYEIARILGLEHLVEPLRALALAMARRRLVRAREARREAIIGEEREVELRGRRARRRAGEGEGPRRVLRLNDFLPVGAGRRD